MAGNVVSGNIWRTLYLLGHFSWLPTTSKISLELCRYSKNIRVLVIGDIGKSNTKKYLLIYYSDKETNIFQHLKVTFLFAYTTKYVVLLIGAILCIWFNGAQI